MPGLHFILIILTITIMNISIRFGIIIIVILAVTAPAAQEVRQSWGLLLRAPGLFFLSN